MIRWVHLLLVHHAATDSHPKVGAAHKNCIATHFANTVRDTTAKVREDPLLAIKQQEQALMSNPLGLEQFREKNGVKVKKDKKPKRNTRTNVDIVLATAPGVRGEVVIVHGPAHPIINHRRTICAPGARPVLILAIRSDDPLHIRLEMITDVSGTVAPAIPPDDRDPKSVGGAGHGLTSLTKFLPLGGTVTCRAYATTIGSDKGAVHSDGTHHQNSTFKGPRCTVGRNVGEVKRTPGTPEETPRAREARAGTGARTPHQIQGNGRILESGAEEGVWRSWRGYDGLHGQSDLMLGVTSLSSQSNRAPGRSRRPSLTYSSPLELM